MEAIDPARSLSERLRSRQARVAVIGLGYVGLPLAVALATAGLAVAGIDVDDERVAAVNAGRSPVADVPDATLGPLVAAGRLAASSDYDTLDNADVAIICVPTPLSKTRDPDISHIIAATDEIAARFRPGRLIVLESTTYPGTTEEIVLPRLAAGGARVGHDFFLAFSPERIDPGNTVYRLDNTPKVLGAITPACHAVAAELYALVVRQVVPVSNARTAEMVKLLENTFRAVNIGLINEVALMCHRLGVDVWEVIEAARTKPYGFMPFYPGPGLGGHCIPLDPYYLAWKLRTLDYTARFIELAGEVNAGMPRHVVEMVVDALNGRRLAVNGAAVLLLGVAYKPNVADTRESPALDIARLLWAKGAEVAYHDPYVPTLPLGEDTFASVPLDAARLATADCVVIVTAHECIDWAHVAAHAGLIIDTRNALGGLPTRPNQVVRL